MATSKISRLAMLVDLAKSEKENLEKMLQALRLEHENDQAQLHSLEEYQRNYHMEVTQASYRLNFQSKQAFLDKVNNAIIAQQGKLTQTLSKIEKLEAEWIDKKRYANALEKIHKKLILNENIRLEKIEQKMLDDLSARHHFLNHRSD